MVSSPQANPVDYLEKAFNEAIAYYQGPGSASKAKVDKWGPKETLAHMIYFCNKNAEGMETVSKGGQPIILFPAPFKSADDANAVTVSQYAGKSMSQVVADARQAHQKMVKTARTMKDLDVPIVIRPNGETQTARVRIEGTANHWLNHVKELKAAS